MILVRNEYQRQEERDETDDLSAGWVKLQRPARRREIDVVIVWRLDHWGRSPADLVTTLQELTRLGIGFISLNEALDLQFSQQTTPQ
jgi:DNA invertase Pin-like site-specific DNA recombinase